MRRRLRRALWYLLCCTFFGNVVLFVLHLSVNDMSLQDADNVKSRGELAWELEQEARRQRIHHTCREVRESDDTNPWRHVASSVSDSMMVDSIDDIIFCPTPHHKSTAWTSALHSLVRTYSKTQSTRRSVQPERDDRIIDNSPQDKIFFKNQAQLNSLLDKNVKVLFVNHPFERLVAVYQDRFSNVIENRRSQYWNRIRRKILRLNHPAASEEEISSRQVTFDEYIQYLVFKQEHNVHWSVTYELCHPCDISYDYIVKFESLQTDVKYIMKALYGSSEGLQSSLTQSRILHRNDIQSMRQYFKQPSLNSLLYLYDLYSLDFYMYNYTWPFPTLTL